jgi:hypothetical protein
VLCVIACMLVLYRQKCRLCRKLSDFIADNLSEHRGAWESARDGASSDDAAARGFRVQDTHSASQGQRRTTTQGIQSFKVLAFYNNSTHMLIYILACILYINNDVHTLIPS